MPKNIVICCDGTDNKLTINENTNVVHLYSCLDFNSNQIAYYNPGVGTIAPDGIRNWIARQWYVFKDSLSASSLETNVMDAYIYLMDHYEDGDKIYLFGFSRGAYTVRMLSGLIEMFGLLHKGNSNHLRYVLEIYSKGEGTDLFKIANSFRVRFSKTIRIHFIGVWDTVVAAGGIMSLYKSFPFSKSLGIANVVRHAIAIDERRKHYDFYPISNEHTNCKEVFFAGVHSDVGGSYREEGLSKIALEWMLGEASVAGLILNKTRVNKYVYGNDSNYQIPNYLQEIHDSCTLKFKIADLIPRPRFKPNGWFFQMKFDWRLWPKRVINDDSAIHESVFKKINETNYNPSNINKAVNYFIEKSSAIKY
ncbi:MAG: DUF2235 domain-containing protein [Flavobacteriales bacterium]|nr:DUF2235 domain-containing protein [Flavobacteriales bacterium]